MELCVRMSVKRHSTYNSVGALVPLLGTLITLPIYLRTIGEERYSILIILWTLLGYFGLFDLGLGRAVTNRIAALKDRTALDREQVFWTALQMNLALGCLGGLLLWGVADTVFKHFINLQGALSLEVRAAVPWISMAFPLLLSSSVMSGALMGREEFLVQNSLKVAEGLLTQLVPLATAILVGASLPVLVIAILCVRVLSTVAMFGLCIRHLPVGIVPKWDPSHVRPLFQFGSWVTVTSVVGPLLTTLDRLFIGAVAGVAAVTYYSVPFSLASRISIVPASLTSALFPRLSSASDYERKLLLDAAVNSLIVIITPLLVAGIVFMEPFLRAWIDAQFATRAAPIGEILMVGLWANCLAYVPFALIQGRGRPDITAKFHLAELLPYLALLWIALEWKGAIGAAVAWCVRAWVDAFLLFWASGYRNLSTLASGAGMLVAGVGVTALTDGTSWQGLAARSGLLGAVVVWAWLCAPAYLKSWLYQLVKGLRRALAANA
jgi:O-antigen/teichoic acid export membrane protein